MSEPEKHYQKGLFIFHRDLRIVDNIGFHHACKQCDQLYTCFIFTPEQVTSKNTYKSNNAIQFMIESLDDLSQELSKKGGQLILLYGNPIHMTRYLAKTLAVEAVFYNRDYSPYAVQRDKKTRDLCKSLNIDSLEYNDYYLYEPDTIKTTSGGIYHKFTPFYDYVLKKHPEKSVTSTKYKSLRKPGRRFEHAIQLNNAMRKFVGEQNHEILVDGGRENGIKQLKKALRNQSHYQQKRDEFTYETTFLSAYLKFGCVSIREVYFAVLKKYGLHSGLIREILWREFFAHVLFKYPDNLKHAYLEKYRHIAWRQNAGQLKKWREGKTGFPLVDACMRQLLETGYMHNRGRMVVATFLTKTLLLNWKLGETFFAQKLTDYDPASNNGNWQSIASLGTDMKPYYRDMNPWIQAKKFDQDCEYIRRWVPELKDVDTRDILNWDTAYEKYPKTYIKPIVVYEDQKQDMLELYR